MCVCVRVVGDVLKYIIVEHYRFIVIAVLYHILLLLHYYTYTIFFFKHKKQQQSSSFTCAVCVIVFECIYTRLYIIQIFYTNTLIVHSNFTILYDSCTKDHQWFLPCVSANACRLFAKKTNARENRAIIVSLFVCLKA